MVAPDRQRQRVAGVLHQRGQAFARHLDGIEPRERGQAQAQGGRPELVAVGAAVLHHQAQTLEAHQVAVGLGRAHARLRGEVAQHQRPGGLRQHIEQGKTHFDRLDAGARLVAIIGRCGGGGGA